MTGFLYQLLRLGAGGGEGVLVGDICRLFGADWFLRPGGVGVPATEAYERCCCTGVWDAGAVLLGVGGGCGGVVGDGVVGADCPVSWFWGVGCTARFAGGAGVGRLVAIACACGMRTGQRLWSGWSGGGVGPGVWRRNFLLRMVIRPLPSILTPYWWYCFTSTTTPDLSHFVGWRPV